MLEHLHRGKRAGQPSGSMQGWGHTYDFFTGLLLGKQEQRVRDEMIDRAQIRPGDRVLDVGCGTGTLTMRAKKAAGDTGKVIGVDVAEDMLETARRKAEKSHLDITYERAGIEDLPFPSSSFDIVLSSLMLHHIHGEDAKRRGIAELYRVLKPGGTLMIAEFQPPKSGFMLWLTHLGLGAAMSEDYRQSIEHMLREAGFTLQPVMKGFRYITYIKAKR